MFDLAIPRIFIVSKCEKCGVYHAPVRSCEEYAAAEKPCPTCGAVGDQECVRGRKPSEVWMQKIALGFPHDSRISANKESN